MRMIKEFFIVFLILSLVFISGCVQTETTQPTGAALEEQAVQEVEQEMEQAIEDISMEDIENALLE